jgi:geranylgeranyl pyrophosphate synthase
MNLGVAFSSSMALDYGGMAQKLGKNVGDDFRRARSPSVVLAFAAGRTRSAGSGAAPWSRARPRKPTSIMRSG